jgi:predicted enzyme related to lactoylglutathione lyase
VRFKRGMLGAVLIAIVLMSILLVSLRPAESGTKTQGNSKMAIHYLEIVSNEADTLTTLYQRMHGVSFAPPDPDLGQARVATQADGTLVGIRKPLANHEQPIMRTYLAVEDIQQAVKKAEEQGATIAYPPTRQGRRGTFAIVILGNVQHGLWQR